MVSRRIRLDLKPLDPLCSKGDARKPNSRPNKLRHIQGIVQRKARGHTAVFDTDAQQYMIGRDGWEIIKRHNKWIDARGIDLGSSLKAGRRLQLVDAMGVVKIHLDGKRYLIVIRQVFFNPSSEKTLLAEDQIDCHGRDLQLRSRVQVGSIWLIRLT